MVGCRLYLFCNVSVMPKKKSAVSKTGRPTILQLVEITGFSQGAISRALNGQGGISDATRMKILKSAREIGYYPNPSARNFKRGYTKRIGMLLPNLANANYSELYENLDLVTADRDYSSILALTHQSSERERNLMYQLSAGEADGLVINPVSNLDNLEDYKRLRSWRYPLLFIYRSYEGFDTLFVDYNASMLKALQYLRDVGHKKVAYVGFTPPSRTPTGKQAVLLELLKDLGMEYDQRLSVPGIDAEEAGVESFRQWREKGKMPTAVVAYNDQTAISIYREARHLGIDVPGDISLLGSDDIAASEPHDLSTVRVERSLMARTIFEMLENRMKHFDSPIRVQSIRSEFILRNSMGPASRGKGASLST